MKHRANRSNARTKASTDGKPWNIMPMTHLSVGEGIQIKCMQTHNLLQLAMVHTSSQELWPKPGYDLNCSWLLNVWISCDVMLPKLCATNMSSWPWHCSIGVAWLDLTTLAHTHANANTSINSTAIQHAQISSNVHPHFEFTTEFTIFRPKKFAKIINVHTVTDLQCFW